MKSFLYAGLIVALIAVSGACLAPCISWLVLYLTISMTADPTPKDFLCGAQSLTSCSNACIEIFSFMEWGYAACCAGLDPTHVLVHFLVTAELALVIGSSKSTATYDIATLMQVHEMYRLPMRPQPTPLVLLQRVWQTCFLSCQPTR